MKKLISMILCCALVLALAGCAGTTVVVGECTCPPESHNNAVPEGDLKTGLAIVPSLSKSAAATADANGKVDFDVTVVAVTVDGNGIIRNCVIDSVGATYEFTAAGTVEKAATVEVLSKNQKGDTYGMAKASPIGKEWYAGGCAGSVCGRQACGGCEGWHHRRLRHRCGSGYFCHDLSGWLRWCN
jgi:hypothetical protein